MFLLALYIGKLVRFTVKAFRYGGTALPGLVALSIDPQFLKRALAPLDRVIVVSGTNGKTTTVRFLTSILRKANIPYVANKAGSNLLRGIASMVIETADVEGVLPVSTAVIESDEGTLPLLMQQVHPHVLVLLNLFRDQLDRYGEVEAIRRRWVTALSRVPDTTLVLNADDPLVAHLGHNRKNILLFGIANAIGSKNEQGPRDVRHCSICNNPLSYQTYVLSHVGLYRCKKCGYRRPTPHVQAQSIEVRGLTGSDITINTKQGNLVLDVPLPGLYNAYNALAAVASSIALHIDQEAVTDGIRSVTAAFGRVERITIHGKKILLLLMKNPSGLKALSQMLTIHKDYTLLFALNDLVADGKDVSWIWDADFEGLIAGSSNIAVTGLRSYDLALRLKHAGVTNMTLIPDTPTAVRTALKKGRPGEELIIIPTYTALLSIRKELAALNPTIAHLSEGKHA